MRLELRFIARCIAIMIVETMKEYSIYFFLFVFIMHIVDNTQKLWTKLEYLIDCHTKMHETIGSNERLIVAMDKKVEFLTELVENTLYTHTFRRRKKNKAPRTTAIASDSEEELFRERENNEWKAGDILPCGHVVESWMLEDGPVSHQGDNAINWLYKHQCEGKEVGKNIEFAKDLPNNFGFLDDKTTSLDPPRTTAIASDSEEELFRKWDEKYGNNP